MKYDVTDDTNGIHIGKTTTEENRKLICSALSLKLNF
jgi:hypothetical protein